MIIVTAASVCHLLPGKAKLKRERYRSHIEPYDGQSGEFRGCERRKAPEPSPREGQAVTASSITATSSTSTGCQSRSFARSDDTGDYFACYLAGHAIELALKAVLIVDGISEDRLKNKFRHKLDKCKIAARKVLPPGVAELRPEDEEVLSLLNPLYGSKSLEYVSLGLHQMPLPERLMATTSRIVCEIDSRVDRQIHDMLGKPTW